MRVAVDREICISAGMCVLTAPEVFDQDEEDGRVILLVPEPLDPDDDKVRRAAMLCPSGALSLVESG